MRRKIAIVAIALSIASAVPSQAESESDQLFLFRDTLWYTRKADMEKSLASSGIVPSSSEKEIYRLDALDFYNVVSGEDYVEGGGLKVSYKGVTVAGYTPSDCHACYVYPIDESGYIVPSEDDSLFYFGWYGFDHNDFADIPAIYDDLEGKLTTLYGDPTPAADDFKSTDTWEDKAGNTIELLINAKNTYVQLGYIASDADVKVDEAKEAIQKAEAESEAEARKQNASNTDGL